MGALDDRVDQIMGNPVEQFAGSGIDPPNRLHRLVFTVDKWQSDLTKFSAVELR